MIAPEFRCKLIALFCSIPGISFLSILFIIIYYYLAVFFHLLIAKSGNQALLTGYDVFSIVFIFVAIGLIKKISKIAYKISLDPHKWDWEYEEDSCTQTMKCLRCGIVKEKRRVHDWGEWKYDKDSCTQVKKCLRCGIEEIRVFHEWGGWKYEGENSCYTVQYCSRCGVKKYVREEEQIEKHEWGVTKEYGCHFAKQCLRCGKSEEWEDHDWGPYEPAQWGNYEYVFSVSVCRRCGEQQTCP